MAIKISDYIMEQEISNASVDDIELARCFAEMEVISAMLDCYAKQEIIAEYTSTNISEFGIFQEADGGEDNSKNQDEKKDNLLKSWANGIINFFKNLGTLICKLFSKVNYGDLIKKVESTPATKWRYSKSLVKCSSEIGGLIEEYVKFGNLLKDASCDVKSYERIISAVEKCEQRVKGFLTNTDDEVVFTQQEMIDILKKLEEYQKNNIPSVRKILKDFDFSKNDLLPLSKKEVYPIIKKCASGLHKTYTSLNKTVLNMTTSIVNTISNKQSRAVNEYYTTNTNSEYVQEFTMVETLIGGAVGAAIGSIAGVILGKLAEKRLAEAPDELVSAIKATMEILQGGDEKLKRNLRGFNRNLNKIKEELALCKGSIATMTLRENKKLNEIAEDLEEYVNAVLSVTNSLFAKKKLDKDQYRIGERIKEMVEECQKIIDFFEDHPVHGTKKD